MTRSISLDIASLHTAYQQGALTPTQLIDELLAHAERHGAEPTWITRLDRAQLAPYLQRLEGESPETLPLYGIPFAIKDNIDLAGVPTTAGSLALADNWTRRDAPLIANLRRAGGVMMGKTNLSEWANIRDGNSTSGWSAVGGLTRNPHAVDRNTCGSSSGRSTFSRLLMMSTSFWWTIPAMPSERRPKLFTWSLMFSFSDLFGLKFGA